MLSLNNGCFLVVFTDLSTFVLQKPEFLWINYLFSSENYICLEKSVNECG